MHAATRSVGSLRYPVLGLVCLAIACADAPPPPQAPASSSPQTLAIAEQGGRPFGGTVANNGSGGTLHCDHGYVEWQIPPDARRTPLVMVHASSTKTWDTTFDGREGFRTIFLRRGFAVYMTDLPRTGRAGQGCGPTSYVPRLDNDQASFTTWRLGLWMPGEAKPTLYPGVQFSPEPEALDEFLRIQYPEFNAPENEQVETDALAVLLDEIGPSVLLTHSSTGIRGWITGTKTSNVAGIVSYEPGNVVFPEGELPPPIARIDGMKIPAGAVVSRDDFLKLTRVPIQILWGDYIPSAPDPANIGPRLTLDNRRVNVERAKLFVAAINRHGGRAVNIMLPEMGVRGNTHFPMMDLNNAAIADMLSAFLQEHGLDARR